MAATSSSVNSGSYGLGYSTILDLAAVRGNPAFAKAPSAPGSNKACPAPQSVGKNHSALKDLVFKTKGLMRRKSNDKEITRLQQVEKDGYESLSDDEEDFEKEKQKAIVKQKRVDDYERLGLADRTRLGVGGWSIA